MDGNSSKRSSNNSTWCILSIGRNCVRDLELAGDLSCITFNIPEFDDVCSQNTYRFKFCASTEGVLYILALLEVWSSPKIICVDLATKSCTTCNAPENLHLNREEVRYQSCRNKATISFIGEEKLNVLVLEDYKKQKWAAKVAISDPYAEIYPMDKFIPIMFCPPHDEDMLIYYQYMNEDTEECLGYKVEPKIMSGVPFFSTIKILPCFLSEECNP